MEEPTPEWECVEVVITAGNAEWLANFTRRLVEDSLVACGHNFTSIRAICRWDGQVHDNPPARLGLHTQASHLPEIVARPDRDHAADVPCAIALPIHGGYPAYLQ